MFAVVDMTELGILLGAVFTAFVAIMGAFFKYMDNREKASREERKDDRLVFDQIIDGFREATRDNTAAMREVAEATKKSAKEAKDRNGHLGEQNIQITEMVARMTNQIQIAADRNFAVSQKALDAIKHVKEQHVDKQFVHEEIVDHETVNHKEG